MNYITETFLLASSSVNAKNGTKTQQRPLSAFYPFSKNKGDFDGLKKVKSLEERAICDAANLGCVRLGSIRNKNNWNNASKHLLLFIW